MGVCLKWMCACVVACVAVARFARHGFVVCESGFGDEHLDVGRVHDRGGTERLHGPCGARDL